MTKSGVILTARERMIAAAFAEGWTGAQVAAAAVGSTAWSVMSTVSNVRTKYRCAGVDAGTKIRLLRALTVDGIL